MSTLPSEERHPAALIGRDDELRRLMSMLDDVRSGASRVAVVSGDAGCGKTALLERCTALARGFRVVSIAGVQSERELAFAGLQQLCTPLLSRLGALPEAQAAALRVTLCLEQGPVPDRLLVGLAFLSLLAEAAAERPLLCVVDDEQWIDRASAEVLSFAGRRLNAESVALLFGTRTLRPELSGFPHEPLRPLDDLHAGALLSSVLPFKMDRRIREQIVSDAHGNPLALIELSRDIRAGQLSGGYGLPKALRSTAGADELFRRRIRKLPPDSTTLLVLAAAESTGDVVLFWRAAEELGVHSDAVTPLIDAGLLELGIRVRLRHPLVRAVVYQTASRGLVSDVHAALAAVTDPLADPDRRAWHLAEAATGLDDGIAGELERSAARAEARGGHAAAAAFLQRASLLSENDVDRARRALAAARATLEIGGFDEAETLLGVARQAATTVREAAQCALVDAQIEFARSRGRQVPAKLLHAAAEIRPWDASLAQSTLLDALRGTIYAGGFAPAGSRLADVAAAAEQVGPHVSPATRPLDDIVRRFEARGESAPLFIRTLRTIGCPTGHASDPRWLSLLGFATMGVWDYRQWDALTDRFVAQCRETGALSELRVALTQKMYAHLFAGRVQAAVDCASELRATLNSMTGRMASYSAIAVAGFLGRTIDAEKLAGLAITDAKGRGEGLAVLGSLWAQSVLYNGSGKYQETLEIVGDELASAGDDLGLGNWILTEVVEAAVRTGHRQTAEAAFERIARTTRGCDYPWARAVHARCEALLAPDEEAEAHYRASIEFFTEAGLEVGAARVRLLYGEWLRRQRRRSAARTQLRQAQQQFTAMRMRAFAERARRELWATGEVFEPEGKPEAGVLTPQETQIAQLASQGLSNPEIGTRLFISARTVEYHLGKVFTKLHITSRGQLRDLSYED